MEVTNERVDELLKDLQRAAYVADKAEAGCWFAVLFAQAEQMIRLLWFETSHGPGAILPHDTSSSRSIVG